MRARRGHAAKSRGRERKEGGEGKRGGSRHKKCRLVYIKMSLGGGGGVVSISVRSSVWSASRLASTAPSFPLLSKPLNSP